MGQPDYLLNFRWRKPARIFQASQLRVEHPEIRKVKYSNLGGFRFGHSTGTGRIDRARLDISSPEVRSFVFRIAATAEGVKSVLRRIRPQEAGLLDAIDADLARLQTQLDALKQRRADILHRAWQHGNVVRLKDVEALLPTADAAPDEQ